MPARKNISHDFPLRGAVLCGDCGKPYTACWSKSRSGKRHAYYICRNRECISNAKSIRKADIETAFTTLLNKLTPTTECLRVVKAMFKDIWEAQYQLHTSAKTCLKNRLAKIEADITTLVDRLIESDNQRVIAAYERKIDRLEQEKLR